MLVVVLLVKRAIVWIQNRFMETPFLRAAFQVVLGGGLVLAAGILFGGGWLGGGATRWRSTPG